MQDILVLPVGEPDDGGADHDDYAPKGVSHDVQEHASLKMIGMIIDYKSAPIGVGKCKFPHS